MPIEYQEVEWIESHGTEYIDANYASQDAHNYVLDAIIQFTSINETNQQLNGANWGFFFGVNNTGDLCANSSTIIVTADTNKHHFVLDVTFGNQNNSFKIDDTTYNTLRTSAYQEDEFAIFNLIYPTLPLRYVSRQKLFNFKLTDNGTLIRNFIPCYRKSDGVIGLYDLCGSICPLTSTPFYVNSGTGTFTKGTNKTELVKCDITRKVGEFSQLVRNGNFVNTDDWRVLYNANFVVANNVGTITSTQQFGSISQNVPLIDTHKYLLSFNYSTTNIYWCVYILKSQWNIQKIYLPTSDSSFFRIFSAKETDNCQLAIQNDGTTGTPTIDVSNIQLFDLTSLFGSGNEPTTYADARNRILQKYHIDIANYVPYGTQMVIERCNIWHDLPREYQRVEWIESDGNQYVDINMKANQDTKVEIVAQRTGTITYGYRLFGSRISAGQYGFFISTNQIDGIAKEYADFGNQNVTGTKTAYTNKNVFVLSKDGFFVDGERQGTFIASSFSTPTNLYLFGAYAQNTNDINPKPWRLWSTILWQANQLVRNFVPCYRKSDNVIGLYDTIEDKFYINQGTGTFGKGADVN